MCWGRWSRGQGLWAPLPSFPASRDPEPCLPFPFLPPESCARWDAGGRVLGGTLLWPLTPPSRREAASPLPAWGTWGQAGEEVVLPSAARSPCRDRWICTPASPSELVFLLVRLRSLRASQMLQPLCSLPGGGGQASWGGGQARQASHACRRPGEGPSPWGWRPAGLS